MAVLAGHGLFLRCHHVGDEPVHFGFDEAELAAVGQPGVVHAGLDRLAEVVVLPQRGIVVTEDVVDHQRLVFGVVGLLATHHLERPDAGGGVGGRAFDAVQFKNPAVVDLVGDGDLVDDAVVPLVFGTKLLAIPEVALGGRVTQVAMLVLDEQRLAVCVHLAGRRPVPPGLGGHAAAGELGNVAGLAGDLGSVVVDLAFLVWRQAMTGFAGRPVVVVLGQVKAVHVLRVDRVAAAGRLVRVEGVAVGADHVGTVLGHVYVEVARWILQRGVEVAVLDAIATAAVEVAGTAVVALGLADVLGDPGQVWRLVLLLPWRAFHRFEFAVDVERVAGVGAELLVTAGIVMAGQAVDVVLVGEVEILVGPAVTAVATGAARLVGQRRAAEIVGCPLLAQFLAGGRAARFPVPVDAFHHLVAGHVVTAQTGLGDFRSALEGAAQGLQLGVIGSRLLDRLGDGLRRGGAGEGDKDGKTDGEMAPGKKDRFRFVHENPQYQHLLINFRATLFYRVELTINQWVALVILLPHAAIGGFCGSCLLPRRSLRLGDKGWGK